jgi:eukaryotic-like serine/threonine-protein kinase
MDPARWEQVQELFHRAAGLNEPERSSFLGDACGEDRALLTDLKGMLDADGRGALVDRDLAEFAGGVLGDAVSARLREFGPYRIRKLLGEGGMGVVYLAERTDLGNLVAIKILRDAWLSPARLERFLMEQRTLAQLNHPSIARLYDANTLPDGTPFFVMEYVDGVPATEYCSRNRCSVEERLKLIRAVAEAVEYAHAHGVIHRDLKPSNIFVREDGSVRLLDFGISKQLDPEGRPLGPTRTAFRSLTLAYASPEQIRGEPASKSTDVYSLGVVLYELLTGRLPFDLAGRTLAEAEQMIATEEPPNPSEIARRRGDRLAWADLDALCCTAMHKDPNRRYSSCAALARDIDHFLAHERLEARPHWWPSDVPRVARRVLRKTSAPIAISTALVVLSVILGLILPLSRKTSSPARSRTVAVLPLQNAAGDHSLDYLSESLADEISRTLGYARSLSLRPPESSKRYRGANINLQTAGRALRVADVVSGLRRLPRRGIRKPRISFASASVPGRTHCI